MTTATSDLLAPWTYQSAELFELETEYLFRQQWMLVGHSNDIPEPGDYLTFDAFNERALIVRGKDKQVRGFHNVCKHRGGKILDQAAGHCPASLTCPFHGWTYSLEGRLQGVPRVDTFPELDTSSVSLDALALEIWLGFIFIRFHTPDKNARSVADQMAPVVPEIAPYLPEQLQPLQPAFIESKPFNWKTIHDVDNEGYHVPTGHPALQQLYGDHYVDSMKDGVMVSYAQLNERPGRNWSVRHYQSILPSFEHLPESYQRQWFYTQLFPNLVFGFYPDMTEIYMTLPVSPTETRMISRTYGLADARPETQAARYLNMRINTLTSDEDDKFVSWLESAMRSSAWSPPILSELESGVRHYHHLIQQQLPVTRLSDEPQDGNLRQLNNEMSLKLSAS